MVVTGIQAKQLLWVTDKAETMILLTRSAGTLIILKNRTLRKIKL